MYQEIRKPTIEFINFDWYKQDCFGEITFYNHDGDKIDTITCDCSDEEFYLIYRIFKDAGCEATEQRIHYFSEY